MNINEIYAHYFVKKGLIASSDAEIILADENLNKKPFYEGVLYNKLCSELIVYKALADFLDIKFTEISFNNVNFDIIKQVPVIFMKESRIIPIEIKDSKLDLIIDSPNSYTIINSIRYYLDYDYNIFFVTKSNMDNILSNIVTKSKRQQAITDLENENKTSENVTDYALINMVDAPAVALADSILQEAIVQNASDIHIEPGEKSVRVRFRIDGILKHHVDISLELYNAVLARYKIMAELDISERRIPQDGKISQDINNKLYDFRVSTLPISHGEKIVIRVYNALREDNSLEKLCGNKATYNVIKRMIGSPHGIILLTGPTGSGKTTTLYSMLKELNVQGVNITTIEDPIENEIEGINQTQVNPKAELTFARALRSILRQDPNIIMIGEIRDEETAHIAVKAAITGHLVLSTIHTNDAISTITRLLDMGIERYLVADALIGAISQRLLRKLCNNCKKERNITKKEARLLEVKEDTKIFEPVGCDSCENFGYKGRTGVFEILEINNEIRDAISQPNFDSEKLKKTCIKTGFTTLQQNASKLVVDGVISYSEFENLLDSSMK